MVLQRNVLTDNQSSELQALAESAGGFVCFKIVTAQSCINPSFFVTPGKVAEVKSARQKYRANLIIFSEELTAVQQRNLTQNIECRVIDRVALILDIFAQRAKSREGKLQVELAQLKHLSTRLIRGWTHLERQRGGIGLRGPGETQLETDRRLIAVKVKKLKRDLASVSKQRDNRRKAREKGGAYSVSLVGYTNSGKSTLFNVFTRAGVYAANQLFATLDTTSRRVFLGSDQFMVLSDTVGFIKNLPVGLVESFKATLTETARADLLIHVIDYSDEKWKEHYDDVLKVLGEVGAAGIPRLNLFNKIDLTGEDPKVVRDQYGRLENVWISATDKKGLDLVKLAVLSFKLIEDPSSGKNAESMPEIYSFGKNRKNVCPSRGSLV